MLNNNVINSNTLLVYNNRYIENYISDNNIKIYDKERLINKVYIFIINSK